MGLSYVFRARQYLMQPGKNDVTIVIPFSSAPMAEVDHKRETIPTRFAALL